DAGHARVGRGVAVGGEHSAVGSCVGGADQTAHVVTAAGDAGVHRGAVLACGTGVLGGDTLDAAARGRVARMARGTAHAVRGSRARPRARIHRDVHHGNVHAKVSGVDATVHARVHHPVPAAAGR